MPDYRIRPARGSEDLAAVQDLLSPDPVSDGIILLARGINGAPLGCAVLDRMDRDTCGLVVLRVAEAGRGFGLGSDLVAACVDRALRMGCLRLVSAGPASGFCARMGFEAEPGGRARLSLPSWTRNGCG